MKTYFFFFCLLLSAWFCGASIAYGQNVQVRAEFRNPRNELTPDVAFKIKNDVFKFTGESNQRGLIEFAAPAGEYEMLIDDADFLKQLKKITIPQTDTVFVLLIRLEEITLGTVNVVSNERPKSAFGQQSPIELKNVITMAGPSPSIESLVQTLPGVAVSSEFSSQYRVRGGNFDENLIYINDVEVYKPLLVRTGQQEGLGVTNSILTGGLLFSTGGFSAQYGDKLSSVLDIEYRKPKRFHGTVELGLLTANLHLEGSSRNKQDSTQAGAFTFLIGGRRFSTRYLLNSLDTQGDYKPEFYDVQSLFTFSPRSKKPNMVEKIRKDGVLDTIYKPNQRFKLSLLTILARNKYYFEPSSRETTFGTVQNVFRLFVGYVGAEQTNYSTGQTALTLENTPNLRLKLKTILSGVASEENELTSVEGGYRLSDINSDFGSDDYGKEIFVRGIGSEIREARNYLSVRILSLSHLGEYKLGKNFYKNICDTCFTKHTLNWGAKYQMEWIDDQLREWRALDSADFARVSDRVNSLNILNSSRISGFLQETWRISQGVTLIAGVRGNYWTLNQEFFVSPRLQFLLKPRINGKDGKAVSFENRPLQIRLAVGSYNQSPFYRELRSLNGQIYPQTRAQRSYHAIAGIDYVFKAFNRPFVLFAEGFFKYMTHLVPFEFENVRIRYYPDSVAAGQPSKGYSYGFDAKLSGEFIRGIDSWVSFSLMSTKENVPGDNKGWVRRPTDQRMIVSVFFQDHVPKLPWLKMNMTLIYNSGLPFGPPTIYENRTSLQTPYYFRVDLGLNALIKFNERNENSKKFKINSIWIGLEVFNLFARENTVSYNWVKDIFETQFAVPNYLSNRLINGRVIVRF